jgi:hypothetical protein
MCPPGERMVLMTPGCDALFIWNVQKFRNDKQDGINCTLFRNESDKLSSEMILEAEKMAIEKWGNQRLFTFVDPGKIKSSNPGYCFKVAGWRFCGVSKKKGLHILEKVIT